jgi:hypothetical protein
VTTETISEKDAPASEPKTIDRALLYTRQLIGTDFLQVLFTFFKASEIHEPGNSIFESTLFLLHKAACDWMNIFNFESLNLTLKGEQFFLNDQRIRPKPKTIKKLKVLIRFFRDRSLVGFQIPLNPKQEELNVFVWTLIRIKKGESAAKTNEELRSKGLAGYEIKSLSWADASEWVEAASAADLTYKQLYTFVKECFTNPNSPNEIKNPPSLEHILYELNSISEEDLIQTICKKTVEISDHPLSHMAVMCAFSLHGWGKSLGLPSFAVVELAQAGLAHPFTAVHATQGLETSDDLGINRTALLLKNLSSFENIWHTTDLQMLTLLEFPIPFGEKGVYELGGRKCYLHFFSRMLRIVLLFQRMITPDRRRQTISPAQAVNRLLTEDLGCDISLVKLFVSWLGLYPMGTFVRLSTGEVGQVCSTSTDLTQTFRPLVKILCDREGTRAESARTIDLSELNDKLGSYKQGIQTELSFSETGLSQDQYKDLMKTISLATS